MIGNEGASAVRNVVLAVRRRTRAARVTEQRAETGSDGQLHQTVARETQVREQRARRGAAERRHRGQRRRDERGEKVMMQLRARTNQTHDHRRLHGHVRQGDSRPSVNRCGIDHRRLRPGSNQISLMTRSCRSTPN